MSAKSLSGFDARGSNAQGITDPVRQNAGLQRQYKEDVQACKGKPSCGKAAATPKAAASGKDATSTADLIPSGSPFSATQMKQLGLALVSVETDASGAIAYNYCKATVDKAAPKDDDDDDNEEEEDVVINRLVSSPGQERPTCQLAE